MGTDRTRRVTSRVVDYTCKVGNDITNDIYNHQQNTSPPAKHKQIKQSHDKKRKVPVLNDSDSTDNESIILNTKSFNNNNNNNHTSMANDSTNSNYYKISKQSERSSDSSDDDVTLHSSNIPSRSNSTHNSTINNTSNTLSSQDILSQLNQRQAHAAVIEQKDLAYATLLDKYNKLKSQRLVSSDELLLQLDATSTQHTQAASNIATHWKSQYQQLKQHNTELQSVANEVDSKRVLCDKLQSEINSMRIDMNVLVQRIAQVESQLAHANTNNQHLMSQHAAELDTLKLSQSKLDSLISSYRLLTSSVIDVIDGGITCKMVNRQHKRIIEFHLKYSADNTECEYVPKKIQMNGTAYCDYFQDNISFNLEQAPLFMRNLLDTLYTINDEFVQSPSKTQK